MQKNNIGIIGIGGFGKSHADTVLNLISEGRAICSAFADPYIGPGNETCDKLIACGARYYGDYNEMLIKHPEMDIVAISTPIHMHRDMSVHAMKKGFNVFLEKPPAVTIQDIDGIIETQRTSGKICAVDFLTISGRAFQHLLERARSGVIGDIISVTGVGIWKRDVNYFKRSPWTGKLVADGKYVLDGTVNNPLSHLLNNCMAVAGCRNTSGAVPVTVQGELYRANRIESEDTSCVRIRTGGGTEVRFYATLCGESNRTAYMEVKGSKGEAVWKYDNSLVISGENGYREEIRYEVENLLKNMYVDFLDVLDGKKKEPLCPVHSCRNFVLSSNGAFESSVKIHKIPADFVEFLNEGGVTSVHIKNIGEILTEASSYGKMPSELPIEWAAGTKSFSMDGYDRFRLFV